MLCGGFSPLPLVMYSKFLRSFEQTCRKTQQMRLVLPLSLLMDILEFVAAWLVFTQVWIRSCFILP